MNTRRLRPLAAAVAFALPVAAGATQPSYMSHGSTFLQSTYLVELMQGSELSDRASNLQGGGYETSEGRPVSFQRWYRTRWTDARITWMTQVTPNLGLIWGFSTGERAEKYEIQPSVKLGFVYQAQVDRQSSFSLRATTIVGGRLREKPCSADYGEIGGVQAVNCRLAATELEPSQTLGYLLDYAPRDRNLLLLQYRRTF